MRAVITGADGQLGRALQQVWPDAIFLTRAEIDLSWDDQRIETVVLNLEPDILINCAAYTTVDQAETDSNATYRVNALAVEAMARACTARDARLIQISTDYVFGDEAEGPRREDHAPRPRSVYGYSKLYGEQLARYCPRSCVVRTSWVFGEGHNFVRTMLRLAETKPEVSVVHDQIGRPTYAADLAQAIRQLADLPEVPPTLHWQNGDGATSWAQFAEAIFQQSGLPTQVRRITTQEYLAGREEQVTAARPANSVFNLELAESLGLAPRPWQDALAEYLAITAPT